MLKLNDAASFLDLCIDGDVCILQWFGNAESKFLKNIALAII